MDHSIGEGMASDGVQALSDWHLMPPPSTDPAILPTVHQNSPSKPHTPSPAPTSSSDPASSPTHDNKDPAYFPSSGHSSSSDFEEEIFIKHCTDPKYIVFDSQLERLLYSLECTKCYGGHISELQKKVLGSMLIVTVMCVCGNVVIRWESQPTIGLAPVGNLLLSASAIFSGQTYEDLEFYTSSSIWNLSPTQNSLIFKMTSLMQQLTLHLTPTIAQARREVEAEQVVVLWRRTM